MKEQLISFETAKLAKEKGFMIHVSYFEKCYSKDGNEVPVIEVAKYIDKWYMDGYVIVTQSLLQKWLRKECNIHICLAPNINRIWYFIISKVKPVSLLDGVTYHVSGHNTYEEALEKGLQEALKLIEDGNS